MSCRYENTLMILLIRRALHVNEENADVFNPLAHDKYSEGLLPCDNPSVTIPVVPSLWRKIIDLVCHHIISHVVHFDTENKISASVNHINRRQRIRTG